MKKVRLVLLFLTGLSIAQGGVKEKFVEIVIKECKKTNDEAEKLATPGRSGNVVRWKTCAAESVQVGDCKLTCADASANIGG